MSRIRIALPVLAVIAAACVASNAEPDTRPVRVAGMAKPLTHGDCPAARRLAAENPGLAVDRNPAPVEMKPAILQKGAKIPPGVIGPKGAVVKADVIIDTLGRADMTTFKIIKSSHPWLTAEVKRAIPKWKYSPAELAGCKVARVYHFSATAPASKQAR
jgi:hypothetical protein